MPTNEGSRIFSRNLQRLMSEKNVLQEDVAKAVGVAQGTVSMWLSGKMYPRIGKMQSLADYLNVNISTLTSEQTSQDEDVAEATRLLGMISEEDKAIILAMLRRWTERQER